MSTGDPNPQPLRIMQIVAAALIMGVLVFLGLALFITFNRAQGQGGANAGLPLISFIAAVMFATNTLAAFVIPNLIVQRAVKQIAAGSWVMPAQADPAAFASDEGRLLVVRQTSMIVTLALLESAAFLGILAFIIEANMPVLVVVGSAIFLMLLNFPTAGKVRAWLDVQLARLAELRQ